MNNTHTVLASIASLLMLLVIAPQIGTSQTPIPEPAKPNIVFIMVDDGRYDEYRPTGAPSWAEMPAIERIVNEGVNFTKVYAPTPMCAPSRASIYTGLYAHQHKVENNNYDFSDSLVTITQLLQEQGYYMGFFGKYGQGFGQPTEFDFFVNMTEDEYINTYYMVNGVNTFHSQHSTTVLGNYVQDFLDSAQVHNDKPFALFFFPFAPHPPNTVQTAYKHIYNEFEVNLPPSWEAYTSLYPNYYYEATSNWIKDSAATVEFIKDRLACLKGVDDVVGDIFAHLDEQALTDSTFILYTSDNGYISGEHRMRAKVYALEESFHVPMFVKYPPWFDDSIVIEDEIIELIDIPTTFLDLINVPNAYGFEGHSLKLLAEPDTMRKYARYEYGGDDDPGDTGFDVPDLRGLRSFDHLYVRAECDCYMEEFYDFSVDPYQQTNQILNPDYQQTIQHYRMLLDSSLLAVEDTALLDIRTCGLVGVYEIEDSIDQDCNGLIDDNLELKNWYQDLDADLFGNIDSLIISVYPVSGYVLDSTDCNDANPLINPSEIDYCDGIDNNCDAIYDDFVVIPIVSPSNPVFFCAGGSQNLTSTPELEGFSPHWYLNGIAIAGATNYTYNANNSGNYSVKFTAPGGCITESAPTVITEFVVIKPKVKNSSLSNDLTINNPVRLSVKKVIGHYYQWYYNDFIIWGATSNKFNAGLPGNHKCEVIDLNGCSSTSKNFLVIQTLKEGSGEIPYFNDAEIKLFPNPTSGNFTLQFASTSIYSGEAQIRILNILGAEIYSQTSNVISGAVYQELILNNSIGAGIYIVELQVGDQKWKQQLVVQ